MSSRRRRQRPPLHERTRAWVRMPVAHFPSGLLHLLDDIGDPFVDPRTIPTDDEREVIRRMRRQQPKNDFFSHRCSCDYIDNYFGLRESVRDDRFDKVNACYEHGYHAFPTSYTNSEGINCHDAVDCTNNLVNGEIDAFEPKIDSDYFENNNIDLSKLKCKQLRQLCIRYHISKSGKKQELIDRLSDIPQHIVQLKMKAYLKYCQKGEINADERPFDENDFAFIYGRCTEGTGEVLPLRAAQRVMKLLWKPQSQMEQISQKYYDDNGKIINWP